LTAHPLAVRLADAARGVYPEFDAAVEVVPSPGPPCDALVAFTGHYVLAADIDADEVAARWPVGELSLPFAPASLTWLAERLGRRPGTHDVLLVTIGDGSGPPAGLERDDAFVHPRVDEAAGFRAIDEIWTDGQGSLVMVGRGLTGRWEVGYEVEPGHRNRGLGRRLVAAARGLVPAGEPLWAQVAPGNATSMRSALAAGFVPVGAEVLFGSRRRSGGPDA
jgi:GNAT superfamily N-acetyltransferase